MYESYSRALHFRECSNRIQKMPQNISSQSKWRCSVHHRLVSFDCLYPIESHILNLFSILSVCRDPDVPTKCMQSFNTELSRCLNAGEKETLNSVQRVLEKVLSLNCDNNGHYFVSMMAGEAKQCIKSHIGTIKVCTVNEFEHIFPVLSETFDFKLRIGHR